MGPRIIRVLEADSYMRRCRECGEWIMLFKTEQGPRSWVAFTGSPVVLRMHGGGPNPVVLELDEADTHWKDCHVRVRR